MVTYKTVLFIWIIFLIEITCIKCKVLSNAGQQKICESSICHDTASKLKEKMDFNINPCDNFYKFMCGNFLNNTVIPNDKIGIEPRSTITTEIDNRLKKLLESEVFPEDTRPVQLAKTFYHNCMNTQRIKDEGLKPLKNILTLLGGWPLLEPNWKDENFDWKEFEFKSRKIGYQLHSFIYFLTSADSKNSSKRAIVIDSPDFDFDQLYLIEGWGNKIVKAYKNYILKVVRIFDNSADMDRVSREIDEIIDFKIQLANISTTVEVQRQNVSAVYNPMSVAELSNLFPYISWLEYLNKIIEPHQVIDENEIINVSDLNYFHRLGEVLNRVPKRVLANYMIWRVISQSAGFLSEDIREKRFELLTATLGQEKSVPRSEECIDLLKSFLNLGVSFLYVNKFFDEETKTKVTNMVDNIRQQLFETVTEIDWMDNETRARALEKLNGTKFIVGFPNELMNRTKIEDYYDGLEIIPGSFLESILNITKNEIKNDLSSLRQNPSKIEWIIYGKNAIIVNAFYSMLNNKFYIPAAILQGEFFNKDIPNYMNYGAIGFAIGHEITHALDDQGSQFDKDGNAVNWWKNETRAKFLDKVKCLVDQYGNFVDETTKIKINGNNSRGENIGDNGGLMQAYRAYRKFETINGEEASLPGFENYTPREMFWISMANTWCSKYTDAANEYFSKTDFHVPDEFRIIGSLQNQKDFAHDFKCSKGSYMNPVNKCVVW